MRALLLIAALSLAPAIAIAQPDAGAARIRTHEERPPEGSLRRGLVGLPRWAVYALGAVIAAGAAGALAHRVARSRRRP